MNRAIELFILSYASLLTTNNSYICAYLSLFKPLRSWLAPAQLPRVGCYFCLDTKVTKKSSQPDRFRPQGQTPGPAC
jgi:hypothetical protein